MQGIKLSKLAYLYNSKGWRDMGRPEVDGKICFKSL
jgi:hypothetical protein